jgi:hypothetical protein
MNKYIIRIMPRSLERNLNVQVYYIVYNIYPIHIYIHIVCVWDNVSHVLYLYMRAQDVEKRRKKK